MKSPIKWVGGKAREIKYFENYIPKFSTYVEPFFGGGALYWYLQPEKAIINDINSHLMNFYKILKNDYDELYEWLQQMELNRGYFKRIVDKLNNKEYGNEIEQAAIFYYLNKTSFSGKWRVNRNGKYNNSWGNYKRENFKKLDKVYSEILQNPIIKNTDYKNILKDCKYDDKTFVFLDPPYLNCDTVYTQNQDFQYIYDDIFDYMKNCKCKVMLICKNDKYINDLFKNLVIKKYDVKYAHNLLSKIKNQHLVIINYKEKIS